MSLIIQFVFNTGYQSYFKKLPKNYHLISVPEKQTIFNDGRRDMMCVQPIQLVVSADTAK